MFFNHLIVRILVISKSVLPAVLLFRDSFSGHYILPVLPSSDAEVTRPASDWISEGMMILVA